MKRLLWVCSLLLGIAPLFAEEWVDVTSMYVTNPRYAGNSKAGWTITTSQKEDTQFQCQEFYNSTFDMYQVINGLPNGKYRLGVQGYYRNGWPSSSQINGTVTAYIYANSTQQKINSIYQETTDYGYVETSVLSEYPRRVVPNSMYSASLYFAAGKYKNSMEVTVTNGTLKIGVKNSTYADANWCILTNWTLEYYTDIEEPSAQNVVINEIEVCNIDQTLDPSGNYGGWVELYNTGNIPVKLDGSVIGDHKGRSYQLPAGYGFIPAGGYKNIWFDHCDRYNGYRQIPFKLDMKGGTITVSNAQGEVIAQQSYPAAKSRISYARQTDGGNNWSLTGTPTPQASNANASWGTEQLAAPEVDADGCFFTNAFNVNVAVPAGCTLVSTTNGSTPTLSNGSRYVNTSSTTQNKSFYVAWSNVYRFRLFQDGKLPSEVVTRSFLSKGGRNLTVPVVSIVANNEDLFGEAYGVMVQGSGNGRTGRGQASPCNWNMDWDRPVNFEYLVPDGKGGYLTTSVNQQVDFVMCGGWSRAWDPHSFKLKANKVYGVNNIDYPFFDSKPHIRTKSLQLRNGGNDNWCRFKDAALQEIIRRSGLYIDGQAWQPVHVFINGTYRYMLNMREPNNRHNAYSNYGIDPDYIDQFEMSPDSGYIQMSGTKDAFNEWYRLSQQCADDQVYQYICDSLVDIDEYINYMAVELYLGGDDWPQNNVKGFRALQDDANGHPVGKFHFVLFDLDHAFNQTATFSLFESKQDYWYASLYGIDENGVDVTGQSRHGEMEFVTIFLNMLKNEQFRKQFVDAFCIVAGSVFEPTRCSQIVSEMQTKMNTVLALDNANCDGTAFAIVNNLTSTRQSTMISQLSSYSPLGLSNQRSVKLSSNVDGVRLLINGLEVPTGTFSGALFGDVKVQAVAPAGYRFQGWSGSSSLVDYQSVFDKGSNWYYYCNGSLDNTSWTKNFPSSASGKAPLGYGGISHSTNLTSSLPTYYFSKSISLTSSQLQSDLKLEYSVDDGFIVYVNGVEAGRYNMPGGSVSYNSYASNYAGSVPDEGQMTLNKSLFHTGTNLICVEVHNNSSTSSDICWDAALYCRKPATADSFASTDSILTIDTNAAELVACFEPLNTDEDRMAALDFPIKINEVGASNDIYVNEYFKKNDWIELYNNTDVDLNVAGLLVSDDATNMWKYKIPGGSFAYSTILPARGKMVLWADKLETVSQVHTGFKLANDPDACVVIRSTSTFENNNAAYFAAHPGLSGFVDMLVYGEHEYNESVGRYPDGGAAIYRFSRPTIGQSNAHLSPDELLGYDQGCPPELGIDEIVVEEVVEDVQQMMERGTIFYDLQGRRVAHPTEGQLLLRRQYPQK